MQSRITKTYWSRSSNSAAAYRKLSNYRPDYKEKMQITLFRSLYDKTPYYTTPESVFEIIKTGGKQKALIEKIRLEPDKEKRDELKKKLGVICFSGKFSERKNSALKQYSRLICLDFDKTDLTTKLDLCEDAHCWAVWRSPSGNGYKALIQVSSDDHAGHVKALFKERPNADTSTKDVCRATFTSFDPDIYINPSPTVYDKLVQDVYTDEQKYEKLKKWLENKGEKFVTGNRNTLLAKLSGAMNRFGLDKDFTKNTLIRDYVGNSDFSHREAVNVVESIYTNYQHQFGTKSFSNVITTKDTDSILSTTLEVRDIIYLDEVKEDLIRTFDNGVDKAPTTYFPSLDYIWRPLPGDLNVLIGIGGYGKSCWQMQLDLIKAVKEGDKVVYFSPENYPPEFWYRELIRSYVGKPLEKDDRLRMSRDEYLKGMDFIKEHFYYIYPQVLPTPDYILERFAEMVIKHGCKRVVLDPFNQLNHLMEKRDDIYLAEVLSKFERFAQQLGVYFTVIAHPNRSKKDSNGNYECPDIYDINGGPVWNARATSIVAYHRPFYGTDKSDPSCEIHSKKIKRQMISGIPGISNMTYDRKVGRFFDNNYTPL